MFEPSAATQIGNNRTRARVLVAENIGASGLELLRKHFELEIGIGWSAQQLAGRIGDFDAILIRSATEVSGDLLARARRLRAIGRAGVGVDNVHVVAATRLGIVVANAPQ